MKSCSKIVGSIGSHVNRKNVFRRVECGRRWLSSLSGFNFNESTDIPFGPFDGGDGPSALLNQNVRSLDMSPTVGINEMTAKYESQGDKVYKFGFGQSPFPVPQFMVNELAKHAHEKAYLPVRGLYQLREAISDKINKNCGLNSTAEDVLVSPGLVCFVFSAFCFLFSVFCFFMCYVLSFLSLCVLYYECLC